MERSFGGSVLIETSLNDEETARILSISYRDLEKFEEAKRGNTNITGEYTQPEITKHLFRFFDNLKKDALEKGEDSRGAINFFLQDDLSFFRIFICDAIKKHGYENNGLVDKLVKLARSLQRKSSIEAPMAEAGAASEFNWLASVTNPSCELVKRISYIAEESFGTCGDRVSNGWFDMMVAIATSLDIPLNKMSAKQLMEYAKVGAMVRGIQDFIVAENRKIEKESPLFSEHIETALAAKAFMAERLIGISVFSSEYTSIAGIDNNKMRAEIAGLRDDAAELSYKYMLEDALIMQTPLVKEALAGIDNDKYIEILTDATVKLDGEPDAIIRQMAKNMEQLAKERKLIALKPFFRDKIAAEIQQDKKSFNDDERESETKEGDIIEDVRPRRLIALSSTDHNPWHPPYGGRINQLSPSSVSISAATSNRLPGVMQESSLTAAQLQSYNPYRARSARVIRRVAALPGAMEIALPPSASPISPVATPGQRNRCCNIL